MNKLNLFLALLLLLGVAVADTGNNFTLSAAELNDTALLTTLNNYFGCQVWSQGSCLQCSPRFYFSKKGICCEVQQTCEQFNTQQGICEQCYQGYSIVNGSCTKIDESTASNIGCAIWINQSCTQCSKRWYFNQQNTCIPVSDLCATWEVNGNCDSCYYGYVVANGICVASNDTTVPNSNLLCKTWSGKQCIECADRTYFATNGQCTAVSTLCNSFNKATGNCLTCFAGYAIQNGSCVVSPSNYAQPADLGCGNWDWNNQICLACSKNWAFNAQKICVPVSDQCATSDALGNCLTCYKGYNLVIKTCIYSTSNYAKPADLGCGTWDWNNQVCLACSNGWVFNANKTCTPVSDQCATHNSLGNCLTCYQGYGLQNGTCVLSASNNAHPSDLGCGTWDWNHQTCLKCSNDWVFNANKQCVPVSDQCATYNATGNCLTCYQGYDLNQGVCLFSPSNNAKPVDLGCATWDWNNQICLACSDAWVFNANKVCVSVSDQCATYDSKGNCLTCYKGYNLNSGSCIFSASNNAHPADLGCGTWDWNNQICLACSKDWVFNAKKACVPVSDQCATFDSNGNCLTCYKGYDLKNGTCAFSASNNAHPADLGCGTWDWNNQVCLACSNGWVFNTNKTCVAVSDQCATHNSLGTCLTCYQGYNLQNGACVFSASNNAHPSDLGCGTWDWNNQICLKCSNDWVFNAKNVCVPVSDQCATSNANGSCLTCFKGYGIQNGQCIFSPSNNAKPADLGCGTWDWDNQICLKCSNDWVFNAKKVCVPVSDQCATSNSNGNCLTCFKGYTLNNGTCIFSASNNAKPSDLGCATWDWNNQVCLACSKDWVFNTLKVCVPVSDQCATFNSLGNCLTCYKGYDIKNGTCVFSASNNATPPDLGCATWDWNNQVCLACSKDWVFNVNKKCVPVSDQCATFGVLGNCLTCYQGYDLKNGTCIFSASNNAKPSDLGCATWDWNNQVCLACSNGWVFNANKACVPVSDQCATHNSIGNCLTCYQGYDLKNGTCAFSASNNAKPSDLGCGLWDWNNQACLKCSQDWVFNSNKKCVPVSDQCANNDALGNCITCYKGYNLKNGTCVLSASNNAQPTDLGCGTWDWNNQVCLNCSSHWFFNSHKVCVPVDQNCNTYDENGQCTSCYQGYGVSDGLCVSVNPLCKTLATNGTCASCYTGYVLHNNTCVPISKLANILLYYAACCPEKLKQIQGN